MARIWDTWAQRRKADPAKERAALIMDYRVTFGSPIGQRVLADIMKRAGVMQTSWGADGAEATAYRQGKQRTALEIIETINADPAAIQRTALTGNTEELFDNE